MTMTRQERVNLQSKQNKIHVLNGEPQASDLREGELTLRKTYEGLVQYVKHDNILYKNSMSIAAKRPGTPTTDTIATHAHSNLSKTPDYDSGWQDVDRTSGSKDNYTLAHGLAFSSYSPTLCQIFICDLYGATSPSASATNKVYPYRGGFELDTTVGGADWQGTDVRIDATNVYIQAYTNYYAFWTYQDDTGGVGTHKYFSRIGLRVMLWE
jgi:hypothetical protein